MARARHDLFVAANGEWLDATPIPADKSAYGVAYALVDRADARVQRICETLGEQPQAPGSVGQKISKYYRTYLDEAAIDAAGLRPLEPLLDQIDAVDSPSALAALWGRWMGAVPAPVETQVTPDAKEPGRYRVTIRQDGLGLPDRDYYLRDGAGFAKARDAYRRYLGTLLTLAGDAEAEAHAQAVYALELQLAGVQWSQVDSRDAVKTYNPRTLPQLARLARGVDWPAYFTGAHTANIDHLSVSQPPYAAALSRIVQRTPLATWKLYQRVRVLDANAPVLPQPFRMAAFAFHGQALRGEEQPRPRWQQATAAVDHALGEGVGQIYVARHFPPEHRARMQALVDNLMVAYGQSIDTLHWMGPRTQARAKDKLSRYTTKIGYPDRWREYGDLSVVDGDALGNEMRARRFEHERLARQVGRAVDRSEWFMTPQTVNAYYEPSLNEIVFPAAILDAPYFDITADDATNYGAIGATIGHEISHGFDDQGSQFDGGGRLVNWWTRADRKAFDSLGNRLAQQFDGYEPVPGHRVNGRLTLGENIADLSGLEIAYKAYRLSLGGHEAPVVDGLTGDQRFFLSYAVSWREKARDARTLQQLTSDPHAPASYRTNGPVVNLDAFHEAFGTRPGDAMYKPRAERIHIW
ncbi:hypothetical protein ASC87_19310 [Rhizobacter sp. Root1221]|nr:hypothetical protein ASC87_19310 [Rhizobacter sp. Root1221]